jgi:isochorismate synthase
MVTALAPRPSQLAFRAFSTKIVAPSVFAREFANEPMVSWSSHDLVVAGIGIAHELRGHGAERWQQVIDAAAALKTEHRVEIDGVMGAFGDLGFARPRFLGGAAFAPGSAERAPWTGFGDAWFVLPRWTYVSNGVRAMFVLAAPDDDGHWPSELARLHALAASTATPAWQPGLVELQPAPADEWRTQVTDITSAIAHGACSKVVAARTCHVALSGPVEIASLMTALDERHPDCVRALIHPPGAGTLVAATPERLVRRDGKSVYCDALAGTISNASYDAREKLLASTKDRREHAIVVDAIRTALEDVDAEIDAPSEPAVRALRHVLHLHTPFRATLREPRHVLELVARLHPTPAVGGTPTPAAIEWIKTHEPVARGWYASPVGWFDFDGNGELAVAIRSGVIAGNRAHLWAGAGIVAGSDPDRELAETEAKLRAMLGALGVGA